MFQTSLIPAVWLSLALSACSALIDVSAQQCEIDSDCQGRSLGERCVEHVCTEAPAQTTSNIQEAQPLNPRCSKEADCSGATPRCMRGTCVSEEIAQMFMCKPPEAPPVDGDTVRYSFKVVEYRSRKPPKDLSARACRAADVTCVDGIAPTQMAADTGLLVFELPRGFLGFFEVRSDAVPALSYLTKPILVDTVDRDLQVSAPATFQAFAMFDGTVVDETRGVALLEAFDCTGVPVAGVHFEASATGAQPFYIVNHVPNRDVKVTTLDPGTNVADGGFVNVPAGFVTFTARYGVDGPVLGTFNVGVRPSTFTFVDMYF